MAENAGIYAFESGYLGRAVQIGIASDYVISVSFPEAVPAEVDGEHPVLAQVRRYLDGGTVTFDAVELALTVPRDHRHVLDAVREIPYGHERDIETVVRMTPTLDPDDEDAAATVRAALRDNPVPIIVPDHRVAGATWAAPGPIASKLRALESL